MIKPIKGTILIETQKAEEKTESGIFLAGIETAMPQKGIVIDANGHADIKNGDTVYYKKWAGEDIDYEGKKYKLINIRDVIAYETSNS